MARISLEIPDELMGRLRAEADGLKVSPDQRVAQILDVSLAPAANLQGGSSKRGLKALVGFLGKVPGVTVISSSEPPEPFFWVKLHIDVDDEMAWRVVQELGYVLNYLSDDEPLPTVFKPISPPSYMNGGPDEILDWVIEAQVAYLDPSVILKWLETELPAPVEDPNSWRTDEESEPIDV